MNSRVYPSGIFEKEVAKLQGKIYCPNCYSFNIISVISYFPYIESNKRGSFSCKTCSIRCNPLQLLTLEQVRDKKINEVINK